jgi:hypothetical protein
MRRKEKTSEYPGISPYIKPLNPADGFHMVLLSAYRIYYSSTTGKIIIPFANRHKK